jgi:hypothetical protein
MLDTFQLKRSEVDAARIHLTRLVDELNDQAGGINGVVTRARSGMRAFYGPDSAQYEQVGGTRQSERKPSKAKQPKTP